MSHANSTRSGSSWRDSARVAAGRASEEKSRSRRSSSGSKSQTEAKPRARAKSQTLANSQTQAKSQTRTKYQVQANSKSQARAKSQTQAAGPAKRSARKEGKAELARESAQAAARSRETERQVARSQRSMWKRVGLVAAKTCGVLLAFVLLCGAILYPVAKPYYVAMRDTQRYEAQIAAVEERNEALTEENESLDTDEGVEAQARNDYGYVMKGENSVIVTGAEASTSITDVPDAVDVDSITAPETWYYDILDAVFCYDNGSDGE